MGDKEKKKPLPIRRSNYIYTTTEPTDAVTQTLVVTPGYGRVQAMVEAQEQVEAQMAATVAREQAAIHQAANQIRAVRRAEAQQMGIPLDPTASQTDEQVIANYNAEMARTASQPQITSANPAWQFPTEIRQSLGLWTTKERELAAKLNAARSNTMFGNVMPNFGAEYAYNNPGAEFAAVKGTAATLGGAFEGGLSFGVPSALGAVGSGIKTGFNTAGNIGARTLNAGRMAVLNARPIITNPRWIAAQTLMGVPMAAAAADNGASAGEIAGYTALGLGGTSLLGGLLYKAGKGIGKYFKYPEVPAGMPAPFTTSRPVRTAPDVNPSTLSPIEMALEPTFDIVARPRPKKPSGKRSVNDPEKQARYDAQIAERDRWDADYAQFQQDHANWTRTAQADYDAAVAERARQQAAYDAAVTADEKALRDWETARDARNKEITDFKQGSEYGDYLKAVEKVKRRRRWPLRNAWWLAGLPATIGGGITLLSNNNDSTAVETDIVPTVASDNTLEIVPVTGYGATPNGTPAIIVGDSAVFPVNMIPDLTDYYNTLNGQ